MFNPEKRIKFIWGASKVIRGRWYVGLVGLYDRHKGVRENGIAISVRGLLAWGGLFFRAPVVGARDGALLDLAAQSLFGPDLFRCAAVPAAAHRHRGVAANGVGPLIAISKAQPRTANPSVPNTKVL
jgi:hypothetical protein